LVDYVTGGGRVLVVDSPANAVSSANVLLHPFGLGLDRQFPLAGALETPEGWPGGVVVETASIVRGGEALITVAGDPVASTTRLGDGTVTAIGFGSRFADRKMGVIGDAIPDATLRNVYELEFRLIQFLVRDIVQETADPLDGSSSTDESEPAG
jgi:hypothetical protein